MNLIVSIKQLTDVIESNGGSSTFNRAVNHDIRKRSAPPSVIHIM